MDLLRLAELSEKYLADSLTQEEHAELNSAINENEEFKKEFEENISLLKGFQSIKNENQVKEWFAEADAEIHSSKNNQIRYTIPFRTRLIHYTSVAAVTILAVLGTLYFSNWFSYKQHIKAYTQLGNNMTVLTNYQKTAWDAIFNSEKSERSITAGTGFAISSDGYIITSYHIVKDFDSIFVVNKNDSLVRYHADLVYQNEASDVAFLKITDPLFSTFGKIPYMIMNVPSNLGEYVYTLGFSKQDVVFGEGSISSLTGFNEDSSTIQISIPSNPGNSGGPLINNKGEVVGMLCAKNYDTEGATYAIKSELLLSLVDSLNTTMDSTSVTTSKRNYLLNVERTKQITKIKSFVFRVEAY